MEQHTLSNGIRIIHKKVAHTKIAHCGIMLDIGSRDENEDQQGIAHFWEHMAFKGTTRRNAYRIINSLESLGGELNAYTTKEKICFYATALDRHFNKAFDVISDITFNSIFPAKQIELERGVILEEMAMYYDSPEDAIQDDFDEILFSNHQLGKNILGNEQSVKSFSQNDFQSFVRENLDTEKIVFASVGNVSFDKVLRLAQKYLEPIPSTKSHRPRTPFIGYQALRKQVQRSLTQAQCAIGSTAYNLSSPQRIPFFMLLNILGGPGMNSRLNMSLREKNGLVYSVETHYAPFTDTGAMAIYFGTEPKRVERCISLTMRELKKLRETKLGTLQLHQAKEQLMGQLAMSEENNSSVMLMMAKSLLDLNRVPTLEEIFDQIKAIDSSQLMDVANASLEENNLSILTFLPN